MTEISNGEKWDRRFLELAALASEWSKDPSTKVGAVIVRQDRSVASVGFNGFPRGCLDDPALYADREVKYERVVHAEMNAILAAGEAVRGYTLYVTLPPCQCCAAHIIQSGIARVVCLGIVIDGFSKRWGDSCKGALDMFAEAGVEVVGYE